MKSDNPLHRETAFKLLVNLSNISKHPELVSSSVEKSAIRAVSIGIQNKTIDPTQFKQDLLNGHVLWLHKHILKQPC